MTRLIDLICLSDAQTSPEWSLGAIHCTLPDVRSVCAVIERQLLTSQAEAWLFWDAVLGEPDPQIVASLLDRPGNGWHAGLRLGMAGQPGLLDFVAPTWMLNRDPDPTIEATSWRLSLRACLIRTDVLRQMGGPHPGFKTLAGAALEMGHRYISRGVLLRSAPALIGQPTTLDAPPPFEDELRFIVLRSSRFWTLWALGRAVLTGYVPPATAIRAWRTVGGSVRHQEPAPYHHAAPAVTDVPHGSVSILIPTVDRYPYLQTLLTQLRAQTIPPLEVLVIDQTDAARRDNSLAERFADLPIRVITLDRAGQCSSRNIGLQQARGEHILFIDDDDEIAPDLIERHLRVLAAFGSTVSSGTAHEVGAGRLPDHFTFTRASDVFPTNNTLIRRDVLRQSGLFDLAYERMPRADGDLGMRIYLSGAFMIYTPEVSVLHHHAPQGGLRVHKVRVITYASSRHSLRQRHLPSVSEIYLALRYFSPRQVRESLWMRAFGTFAIQSNTSRKLLKAIIALVLLPDTAWKIRKAHQQARQMLHDYPHIPTLKDDAP